MNVDAVVLDIDGVLVDVADSYRRAIVDSIDRVYGQTIERSTIQAFKNAGGFNNDWQLTDGAALYLLASREGLDMSVDEFTDTISRQGGGVDAVLTVLNRLPEPAQTRVTDAWDHDQLREVFQALYLGPDRYEQLEGGEPPVETSGYIEDEPVIASSETLERLQSRYDVGVLTGRPAGEAEIALDRVGLTLDEHERITMDDPAPGKPAPEGLIGLAELFGADRVAFVGDTLDDIHTATNAETADPDRDYHGLGTLTGGLTGETGRQKFVSTGATAVLSDINALPDYLES